MSVQIECGEFKQQVRHALEDGAEYASLRRLVLRFYESGATQHDAYDALQDIWFECRYDEDDHSQADQKRDELESLMERVWYCGH